jgi:hypothetical protein
MLVLQSIDCSGNLHHVSSRFLPEPRLQQTGPARLISRALESAGSNSYKPVEQLQIKHLRAELVIGLHPSPFAVQLGQGGLVAANYGLDMDRCGNKKALGSGSQQICLTSKPWGGGSEQTAAWLKPQKTQLSSLEPSAGFSRAAGLQQVVEGDALCFAVLYCSSTAELVTSKGPPVLAILPVTGGIAQEPVVGRGGVASSATAPKLATAAAARCVLLLAGLCHACTSVQATGATPAAVAAHSSSSDVPVLPTPELPASYPAAFSGRAFQEWADGKLAGMESSVHANLVAVPCTSALVPHAQGQACADAAVQRRAQEVGVALDNVRVVPLLVGVTVTTAGGDHVETVDVEAVLSAARVDAGFLM